jgi:hypothetical protein
MPLSFNHGKYAIYQDAFDAGFNATLLAQYLVARNLGEVKKTHFFNGRFENIYLSELHAPLLKELKAHASQITSKPV